MGRREMGEKPMRQAWALVLLGLFLTIFVLTQLNPVTAASDDGRIKTIKDNSISGLQTPVPQKVETEQALVAREKDLDRREAKLKEQSDSLAVEESRLRARAAELEKLYS